MAKHVFDPRSMMNLPSGFALDRAGTGLVFSVEQIPASHHFFYATDFMVGARASQLYMVFGSRSLSSNSDTFDRAIEVIFPLEFAIESLVDSIWNRPGDAGGPLMFIESIEKEAKKFSSDLNLKEQIFSLPKDSSNFRQFPANLAATSIGQGQAMIEFFEASPGLLTSVVNRGSHRPDDGVSSLVSIVMDPATLYQLLVKLKNILPAPQKKQKEAVNENSI